MKPHEPPIDAELVRGLLQRQLPAWADQPLVPVESAGTDNAIFRLGERMAVRLPKVDWAAEQPATEHKWLPVLACSLPLPIPVPLALGEPDLGYPWRWSICAWLEGEAAVPRRIIDPEEAATQLGGFVQALRRIDAAGAPAGGPRNHYRGVALDHLDGRVRSTISTLGARVDGKAALAAWELAMAAPRWDQDPVWTHGDLHPQNLLALEGRLSGVIDFGLISAGDPATDLMPAWSMFQGVARERFHEAAAVDDHTWARGRGWALYTSLIVLPYFWDTNPVLVRHGLRTLAEVLSG